MINDAPLHTPAQDAGLSCRRTLAFFLAIPGVFLLLLALWAFNVKMTLLSPSFLKRIPEQQGIYERLPEMILGVMTDQSFYDQEDLREFKETIGEEPLEQFIKTLLPPTWIQGQVEMNIDILFRWLEGDISYPNLHFQYSEIGQRVQSQEVRNAMRNMFSNLPPCESEQDFYWHDFPRCRPPEDILETFIEDLLLGLQESFPSEPRIQEGLPQELDPSLVVDLEMITSAYDTLGNVLWGLWGSTLIIWLFIPVLAANSLDGILTWIGWPIFAVGAFTASIVLILIVTSPSQINSWFTEASQDPAINPYLLDLLSSLVKAFVQNVLGRWLILSGMFSLLGGASLVLAIWLRRLRGL